MNANNQDDVSDDDYDTDTSSDDSMDDLFIPIPKLQRKFIKIRIVGLPGTGARTIQLWVNKTIPLGKMKKIYSRRVKVNVRSLRFMYNGMRVNDEDKPEKLQMVNNSEIHVFDERAKG